MTDIAAMPKATLVATIGGAPSLGAKCLKYLSGSAEWLEVRADLLNDLDPEWLRNQFKGRLLYSLRSRVSGGEFNTSVSERRCRLLKASERYDLVELESDIDLEPDILARIPPEQRLISWSGSADSSEVMGQYARLSSVQAGLYKLVFEAKQSGEELIPLSMLKALRRSDVVAFAGGEIGLWTRIVAPYFGAPVVFGNAEASPSIADFSISQLRDDYGLPILSPFRDLYGIVGSFARHSLSPRLHNAAYAAMGRPALFVPFPTESFGHFWRDVVMSEKLALLGLSIRGLTVASPHKEAVLEMTRKISPMVRRACSSNVIARRNGHWAADTTDPDGVTLALADRGMRAHGKKVAVVGCGGAGRAVAGALSNNHADVTLVNRGLKRGRWARHLLNLPFVPLSQFDAKGFSIVVNATPVGRDDDQTPIDIDHLASDAVVVDLVYRKGRTQLISRALDMGLTVIDGTEVLLIQASRQFRLMTGCEMPEGLARKVLGLEAGVAAFASLV